MVRGWSLRSGFLAVVLASLGLAACATTPVLKPEPGDAIAPGTKNIVQTEVSGVQLLIGGDSWKGDPSNLGQLFTPVKVTIANNGEHDLRVSYTDFSLSGSSGFKYSAIPPMSAKGQISLAEPSNATGKIQPAFYEATSNLSGRVQLAEWHHRYDHDHFFVAPHFHTFYPGWSVWPYGYPYDPFYYDSLYAYWPEQLPTQDMLSQALPEGVVQNGGRVSGFVYFQGVGSREASVTFAMNLVDAKSGQSFGQVSVPFAVGT